MQIDGKSYTLKSNENENKIGLLAQEIFEVFPELVKSGMNKNETLSVNYQGLIPVLINAIKEQQNQIDELMVKIKLKRNSENETE
jgi:flagellar biosynthesis chaperone FliJ